MKAYLWCTFIPVSMQKENIRLAVTPRSCIFFILAMMLEAFLHVNCLIRALLKSIWLKKNIFRNLGLHIKFSNTHTHMHKKMSLETFLHVNCLIRALKNQFGPIFIQKENICFGVTPRSCIFFILKMMLEAFHYNTCALKNACVAWDFPACKLSYQGFKESIWS